MSPTGTAVTRHWGNTVYTSAQVSAIPLSYDREATPVGQTLPGPFDHGLRRTLEQCTQVVVAFDGKMGDSLLAFGAVTAVTDALSLLGRSVPLTTLGRYGRLHPARRTDGSHHGSLRLIVGDEPGTTLAHPTGDDHVLLCCPERAHCRDDGRRVHTFLPARYYLGMEERFGQRLPGSPPFLPSLAPDTCDTGGQELTIAAVTATSWPSRKDYGAQGFAAAARIIGERVGRKARLLLVSDHDGAGNLPMDTDGIRVEPVRRAGLKTLISRFARCDVVLGNDTGLTHLAALASRRAEVIGLYGRHSHSKWRTGLARHHALATPFSESMHRWDMCPVRDGLDEAEGERYAPLSAISPVDLADTAVLALERGYQ
ncbi:MULTISPECIES: glycosyltransferase family 9 protein [unclassified Nocardiopsis]|uniref:glycosyltransferase family 9 protein n=1 Tax=unclassified Nocardiopsis TaxID=2649073 RepID=UPI001359E4E4|nr:MULTISPECIES: glycosyltransferase family 9 protein [unclassified Nocardiopsis]